MWPTAPCPWNHSLGDDFCFRFQGTEAFCPFFAVIRQGKPKRRSFIVEIRRCGQILSRVTAHLKAKPRLIPILHEYAKTFNPKHVEIVWWEVDDRNNRIGPEIKLNELKHLNRLIAFKW